MGATVRVLTGVAVFVVACDFGWASYCIYVGKNLTADGSVFLAGYGDEPSSHWLEIVPGREWPSGATIKVGATAAALFPGVLIEIPQVHSTAKYITMTYSSFAGFPAPLTNGGLNQYLVAARDIWSPSREELQTIGLGSPFLEWKLFLRGLLAYYAARGVRTGVVICTGGEEGEIHDPTLDPVADRPRLRAA